MEWQQSQESVVSRAQRGIEAVTPDDRLHSMPSMRNTRFAGRGASGTGTSVGTTTRTGETLRSSTSRRRRPETAVYCASQ
jgi:hypothetical protein